MTKVYHLANCSTCQRILNDVLTGLDCELQDIKSTPLSAKQIDEMKEIAGSFEALFSRRARKYRSMGLNEKTLAEEDYRQLIHEEYTFLKRPVVLHNGKIFVGSAAKTIEALRAEIS